MLSSRSAVLAAVSFSKVTVADCELSPVGVTDSDEILPLKWLE